MNRIVICGSMKVKDTIVEVSSQLSKHQYHVELPVECMQGLPKMIASRAHFNRIIDEKNSSVLIVNAPKQGIDNYIGPNTFAEIAFAFHFHKTIYLLYDIYEPYREELEGWGVIPLKGNLSSLWRKNNVRKKDS